MKFKIFLLILICIMSSSCNLFKKEMKTREYNYYGVSFSLPYNLYILDDYNLFLSSIKESKDYKRWIIVGDPDDVETHSTVIVISSEKSSLSQMSHWFSESFKKESLFDSIESKFRNISDQLIVEDVVYETDNMKRKVLREYSLKKINDLTLLFVKQLDLKSKYQFKEELSKIKDSFQIDFNFDEDEALRMEYERQLRASEKLFQNMMMNIISR